MRNQYNAYPYKMAVGAIPRGDNDFARFPDAQRERPMNNNDLSPQEQQALQAALPGYEVVRRVISDEAADPVRNAPDIVNTPSVADLQKHVANVAASEGADAGPPIRRTPFESGQVASDAATEADSAEDDLDALRRRYLGADAEAAAQYYPSSSAAMSTKADDGFEAGSAAGASKAYNIKTVLVQPKNAKSQEGPGLKAVTILNGKIDGAQG